MIFKNYMKPTTLDEAYNLLTEDKSNAIIGGGAWLKLQNSNFNCVISLDSLGLNEITEDKDFVYIGASATLRQIETNKIVEKESPLLIEAIKTVMGMNVRNIATIGGSVIGKFSFSDLLTPLLVMDTYLVFYNYGEIPLQEFLNKKFPKDLLTSIKISKECFRGYFKTVKKTALDFSVLNIAITKGDVLRIAVGARPGIAKRTFMSEKFDKIDDIINHVMEEISLSTNMRASKEYRDELLNVYLKRGLMEVLPNES